MVFNKFLRVKIIYKDKLIIYNYENDIFVFLLAVIHIYNCNNFTNNLSTPLFQCFFVFISFMKAGDGLQ